MLGKLIQQFADSVTAARQDASDEAVSLQSRVLVERISALLLVEVARSDFGIDDRELDTIAGAIAETSSLDRQEVAEIVTAATSEVEQSLSMHENIKMINDNFDYSQKQLLVEQMWRVAYADARLDRYEEAFIRRLCDLIYVSHRDFIQAKLRVVDNH